MGRHPELKGDCTRAPRLTVESYQPSALATYLAPAALTLVALVGGSVLCKDGPRVPPLPTWKRIYRG